ncbi:MAG: hypothetical protein Phog2KO_01320 [Phototrophicaceae bacterium]
MTTVIDHAIAIPIRTNVVWDVIRDISNNPTWHPDCQRVQFLTTMKNGRGTRWRNTTMNNKEQVMEITAWYEGLGYEYRIVDGSDYPQNRGRVRLQESPEGTVVQWTFSYEIDGFLGNLRNRFMMKGHIDKLVVRGLRNLYTMLKDTKNDDFINPEDSKAYLKEAPNVEERASYQPRYPSKIKSQEIQPVKIEADDIFKPPASQPVANQPIPFINEPPLTDDDTRPNPSVQIASDISPIVAEPDFLKAIPDAMPVEDERFINPVSAPIDKPITDISEQKRQTEEIVKPVINDEPVRKATIEPLVPGQDTSHLDTSKISVFELFGIDKPSETEQVTPITAETLEKAKPVFESPVYEPPHSFMDSAPIIPDIQPEMPKRRRGLRVALRQGVTKIRIPKVDDKS